MSNAPAGTFTQIDVADSHGCGVRSDGSVVCWGNNDENRVTPVPVLKVGLTYTQVSVGNWHSCALVSDGSIVCWGSADDGRVSSTPTTGTYTYIDAGDRHSCAIRSDGHVVCWGTNSSGQCIPLTSAVRRKDTEAGDATRRSGRPPRSATPSQEESPICRNS